MTFIWIVVLAGLKLFKGKIMLSNTKSTLIKHLKSKLPLTNIEATVYYGICSADRRVVELKKSGLKIIKERVSLNDVVKRINKTSKMTLPSNVRASNVFVSQYRIK